MAEVSRRGGERGAGEAEVLLIDVPMSLAVAEGTNQHRWRR